MKVRKNMIMDDSYFIKLLYSDENLVMNSVYIDVPLINYEAVRNQIFFSPVDNDAVIQKIGMIEKEILMYYKMVHQCTKNIIPSLQLERGQIKFNSFGTTKTKGLTLKISGIWESNDSIGLNCKWYREPTVPL